MYKIQANHSGTRSIEVSDAHLQTIEKYQLLRNLIDSTGYVDEDVVERLRLGVRSLLESESGQGDRALLDLCLDVIYNANMKALGLRNLATLYAQWKDEQRTAQSADAHETAAE